MNPSSFGRLTASRRLAAGWLVLFAAGLVLFVIGLRSPDALEPYHLGRYRLSAYGDSASTWPITLQVVLGAGALATYYLPRARLSANFLVPATSLLAASTIVLGTIAYATCSSTTGQSRFWTPLTFALNLLAGNVQQCGEGAAVPPALQLVRLFGSLVLLFAALGVLATVFRNQSDVLHARLARSLIVVVGLTDGAVPLVAQLTTRDAAGSVIVLVPDLGVRAIPAVRRLGADVVVVHPDDAAGLRRLLTRWGRFKVRQFFAVSADAGENLDWAARVGTVADTSRRARASLAPRMVVRIDDPWHAEVWRRSNSYRVGAHSQAGSAVRALGWTSDALSIYEMTASMVLDRVLATRTDPVDRLVLIGDSPLALAICSEFAQREREAAVTGAELPFSSAELVLFGRDAGVLAEEHRLRQTSFGNAWSGPLRVEAGELTSEALRRVVAGAKHPAIVYADHPSEIRAQPVQYVALLNPGWLVLSWEADTSDLTTRPTVGGLHPFGLTNVLPDMLPLDSWERAARVVHEQYLATMRAGGWYDPKRPTHRGWDQLDPFYRESNIRLITTTLASLEALGRSSVAATGAPAQAPLSEAELDRLAQLEHRSWSAHLRAHHWRYGSRDDVHRRHPALRSWEHLTPGHRRQTRENVDSALTLLRALGYIPAVRGPDRDA